MSAEADAALAAQVGAEVKRWRLRRRLTQGELARKAQITVPTVARLESGRGCHLMTVAAVARALDLEPGVFFPGRPRDSRVHDRGAAYDDILHAVERMNDADRVAVLPILRTLATFRPRKKGS